MSERKTRPAKEEDFIVPNGSHAMSLGDGSLYELRPALVDGIPANVGIDSFGGYSERIRIDFDHQHDAFGPGFQTKYEPAAFPFHFPGLHTRLTPGCPVRAGPGYPLYRKRSWANIPIEQNRWAPCKGEVFLKEIL